MTRRRPIVGRRMVRTSSARARPFTPAGILGSLLHADFDLADPGVVLNAGGVASIPNRGTDSAAAVQATAGSQPVFSATSFGGGPGATFDGVDDNLLCTFATPIPAGRRPYLWCVFKANNVSPTNQVAASLHGNALAGEPYMVVWTNRTTAPSRFSAGLKMVLGGTADSNNALADTETSRNHLTEVGDTIGGLAGYVYNGVSADIGSGGVPAAPTSNPLLELRLGAYGIAPPSQFSGCVLRRVIVANDLPSAAQLLAMRSYLWSQPYALSPPVDPLTMDWWDAERGITYASGAFIDSWAGQKAGVQLKPPAGSNRMIHDFGAAFKNTRTVQGYASGRGHLSNPAMATPVAANSRPYTISAYQLRVNPVTVGGAWGVISLATGAADVMYLVYQNFAAGSHLLLQMPGLNLQATPLEDLGAHVTEAWADGTNLNVRDNGVLYASAYAGNIGATAANLVSVNRSASIGTHYGDIDHVFHMLCSAKPSEAFIGSLKAWLTASKGTP